MQHNVARQRLGRRVMCAMASLVSLAGVARADVDMTGNWTVTLIDLTGQFHFTQTGSVLEVTQPLGLEGTIDPVTGQCVVESIPEIVAALGCVRIEATVTGDGNQFSGLLRNATAICSPPTPGVCQCGPYDDGTPIFGVRCPTTFDGCDGAGQCPHGLFP
jgi:hypothetical protein